MKTYLKKTFCIMLIFILIFSCAGCNSSQSTNTASNTSVTTMQSTRDRTREEYEIKVVDGKYYIDYNDIEYYLNYDLAAIERCGFESVEWFKQKLDKNNLVPYYIALITYFAKDKTDPLLIIDFNDFYVPEWPPYVTTGNMYYYNCSNYGYASYPISSSCYDCYSCVRVEKIPKEDYEKGLQEYQSRSTNEEWTCKFFENGNKRLYVSTIKSDHSDDHIDCYGYGEENGLYFEIEVSAPKELLTDEFICSIGMEKYEYVP